MKKAFFILIIAIGISSVSFAHAVNISPVLPSANGSNPCPTPTSSSCNPGNFILSFYQFVLLIGGILAFGAIVFGGVKYMTSAGNPSAQHEGKEWIESALLGILLLVGAYLILNTINPALTHLDLPTLQQVNLSNSNGNGVSPFGGPNGGSSGGAGTTTAW